MVPLLLLRLGMRNGGVMLGSRIMLRRIRMRTCPIFNTLTVLR